MSFNSKAYLAYEERLLEPDSVIRTGNQRRYEPTTLADKWAWLDSLTPQERGRLRNESQFKNYDNE